MARQSLKLQKFITDQVADTFGHVQWPSIFCTPAHPHIHTHKHLRHWKTGLVSSRVSLTTWGEGASLFLPIFNEYLTNI